MGLATSAVPLDAVLSAAGARVVGFTPLLAAGLFGQNKAKRNSNYLKKSMQLRLYLKYV